MTVSDIIVSAPLQSAFERYCKRRGRDERDERAFQFLRIYKLISGQECSDADKLVAFWHNPANQTALTRYLQRDA